MKRSESEKAPSRPGNPTDRDTVVARNGFTLLEVLAAVAILGVWYMIMATIAMQGLRAEGQSQRRLRASLVADKVVADLEAAIATRNPPVFGEDQETLDEFTVVTSVEPYILSLPAAEAATGGAAQPQSALQKLTGEGGQSPISQIRVEVTWVDGREVQSVVRETFGLDLATSLKALQAATPVAVVQSEASTEATSKAAVDSAVTFPEDDSS